MSVSLSATGVQTPVNYFLCCGHMPRILNNDAAVFMACTLVVRLPVGHYFAVLQVQAQLASGFGQQQQCISNG